MKNETVESWLDALAARTPTPGGGAAAALAAATSAALIGMVTNYTTGEKWADREQIMKELTIEASTLRLQALELADADAAAFAGVGAAYKLPNGTDSEKAAKSTAIQTALIAAAVPPQTVAELSKKLVDLCEELIEASNPNVISDVAVAASMAHAALESAIINIEINQQMITDKETASSLMQAVQEAANTLVRAEAVVQQVRSKIKLGSK